MRSTSLCIRVTCKAGLVLALFLTPIAPAFAQWYDYQGYQATPAYPSNGHPGYPSYPAYPAYPNYPDSYYDPVSPPAAPPYRTRSQAYGTPLYEDPYAPAS
ncbi:MAG TPA: hypothetical protein VMU78_10275, partial [Methylocella sp.]|nr:hypothetical protein [Methylocella sp.]